MSLSCLIKNLKYLCKHELFNQCNLSTDLLIEQILHEINSDIIKKPDIMDYDKTIKTLQETQKSLVRFGDGEISIIKGKDILFQKKDSILANRMQDILKNNNDNILVGINYEYYYPNIKNLLPEVANFYRNQVPKLRNELSKYINFDKEYCAAAITQLYLFFNEYNFEDYYEKFKTLWNNKKILIVTCKEQLNNIDYNIYDNAKQIDYLYIPPKNAFSDYNEILSAIKAYKEDTLIILMAGPTAKVLVEDLTNIKYRALDLGHLMKDYDWYKKRVNRTSDSIYKFMAPDC